MRRRPEEFPCPPVEVGDVRDLAQRDIDGVVRQILKESRLEMERMLLFGESVTTASRRQARDHFDAAIRKAPDAPPT